MERQKRQVKKGIKSDAFELLKKARRGEEVQRIKEEQDVYEFVSEEEYSKMVHERQQDDWIVDDGRSGYKDDGRDIIYDYEEEVDDSYLQDDDPKKKKKKIPVKKPDDKQYGKSIKSFFVKQEAKKKTIKLEDDQVLEDILKDINEDTDNGGSRASMPVKLAKKFNFIPQKTRLDTPPPAKMANKRKLEDHGDFEDYLDPEPVFETTKKLKLETINEPIDELDEPAFGHYSDDDDDSTVHQPLDESVVKSENDDVMDDQGNLDMFWLDAHEDQSNPGRVYIFGKIRQGTESIKHLSCCVIVENIMRKIYLLPKLIKGQSAQMVDVLNDLDEMMKRYHVNEYKSKKVLKKYCFDAVERQYLEVLYLSKYSIPNDFASKSFSVFGTSQTSIERMILESDLNGPCWLKISRPQEVSTKTSWCNREFTVNYSKNALTIVQGEKAIPPLTVCCLKTATSQNQIAAIVTLNFIIDLEGGKKEPEFLPSTISLTKPLNNDKVPFNNYEFNKKLSSIVNKLKNTLAQTLSVPYNEIVKADRKNRGNLFNVKYFPNERAMLNLFFITMERTDADILIGHDFQYELDSLLNNHSNHTKSDNDINWSRIGRLRRRVMPKTGREKQQATVGRPVCDVKTMAKELIRLKNYELNELVSNLLKKERRQFKVPPEKCFNSMELLSQLIDANWIDTIYAMMVMNELNVIPLTLEITKIAGNLLSRTLQGGRAERNEYLLLHKFHEKNIIAPDKVYSKGNIEEGDKKKRAAYAGGLVLDPKVGFYENFIILMDFLSLYPSIIQEYNICFTTIKHNLNEDEVPETPDASVEMGVLPSTIKMLVDKRREVKKLMLDKNISAELKSMYNIKQMAFKLTANSMYGCLGFSHSRFYAKPLAALTTSKGREILLRTKNLVESMGLEVIYGDTDSIMINTNSSVYDEIIKIGLRVQSEVNKFYKLLEIEIDGVYKSMLLLKKKKYAALSVTKMPSGKLEFKREVKGLDIVRRDWSILAKNAGETVLDMILSGQPNEEMVNSIHTYLRSLSEQLRGGSFAEKQLQEFIISKQLTRNPEDYPESKNLVHVLVALRFNSLPEVPKKLRSGDVVEYCIVKRKSDETYNSLPATQRAVMLNELNSNEEFIIDTDYYITQQVLPVVTRLCDPIESTDASILGEFMGVYNPRKAAAQDFTLSNADSMYDNCKSLSIVCPEKLCGKTFDLRQGFISGDHGQWKFSLAQCPHCMADFADKDHQVQIEAEFMKCIKSMVNLFYQAWVRCEDPVCNYRTRSCTAYMEKGFLCSQCYEFNVMPEITEADLYKQLSFYEQILDLDSRPNKSVMAAHGSLAEKARPYQPLLELLLRHVRRYKSMMSFSKVDLESLFSSQTFTCIQRSQISAAT